MDPDKELKEEIAKLYPQLDALMIEVVIKAHRKNVELYGEDYTDEQVQQADKNVDVQHNDSSDSA